MPLKLRVEDVVAEAVRNSIAVKEAIARDAVFCGLLAEVGREMSNAVLARGKILFFGNGGSAADAQHLTAELTGRYLRERRALPAIALCANTSSLTAIGNDYAFDQIFARQLEALGVAGDVAVGISTSGNSQNVIQALKCASQKGMLTVALTGERRTAMAEVSRYWIGVPSLETPRIQEAHIMIGHILCDIIERALLDG